MASAPFGFGRLWPVVPGQPEDEATPVGLAPGQMPVDPRRDGSVQPTVAGKNLSRAVGVVAGNAAQGLLDAATAPKRALDGDLSIFDPATGHVSDEAMGAGAGIAGLALTGSLPMKVPAGAIRSFGGAAKDPDPLAALEAALGDVFATPAPAAAAPKPINPAAGYAAEPRRPMRVDPDAKAWDLYHGSKPGPDFQRFDPNIKTHSEQGAVFFAPEPNTAATYAGSPGLEGFEAGPRIFRATVDPGKTAVFDIGHLAETDPAFNAQARAIYAQEAGPRAGPLFDRYLRDFHASRAQDRQIAEQVRAMGFEPSDATGASFGYGHIGAAIQRAKEQGLDTAVLRGLSEHGGDDQVIALTPGRVRSYYAPDQLLYAGAPAAVGLAGAAALAPGDAQASPSPSGAPPMAFGFGSLSGLPADVLMRQRQGMPEALTLGDPVATMLGPDQAPARAPIVQPQAQPDQPVVAPFGFGALAPRVPAAAGAGMGFGPGSPGAGLPLPAQEPVATGATAPAIRQAPPPAPSAPPPAPAGSMTSAPLPPPRPPEFGSSAEPGQPLDIRPPAQAAAVPAGPSTWDRVSNFLGNNSDMLIGIGTGLMSTPGFGRGLASGVQQGVAMQNASAAQGLARAKQAVEMQKLAREQGGITANAGLLKRAYPGVTDEQATALAATPSNVQEALKILRDPNHGTGVPAGFRMRADGSGYEAIAGGPQDPATIKVQAEARQDSTKAPTVHSFGQPDGTKADRVWNPETGTWEAPSYGAAPPVMTAEDTAGIPPGVDPDTYRKELAKSRVKQAATATERAQQAQGVLPVLDRAEKAYEALGKMGAIGPLNATGVNRFVGGVFGADSEKLRQEFEAAAKELELTKAQISMKGQGAISENERKILALTLPRLDAADPQTGLNTLRAMRTQFNSAIREGGQQPAASASGSPQQPASTPDPLAAARAAISQGADRKAVIQRLLQNKIDPRGL